MRWVLVGVAALGAVGCGSGDAPLPPPLVLLVTLDTTRADHLGCYGYARPTSPNLDRLARDARVYENAIATETWTLPSHASLFTGKLAASHGARNDPEGGIALADAAHGPPASSRLRFRSLGAHETTLAERLRVAGYATAAVVAGPFLKRDFGLDRGFDVYDDSSVDTTRGRTARSVTNAAIAWLARTPGRRFLFVNYFDPHSPYVLREAFAQAFGADAGEAASDADTRVLRYDSEIRFMDHHLGRLLEALRQHGLYEPALIVITADHGELFGERGEFLHGGTPLQGVVRIPLLVKEPGPDGRGDRSDAWVSLTDLLPLILDRVGLAIPPDAQGGVPPRVDHPIVAESRGFRWDVTGPFRVWIEPPGWKLLWREGHAPQLYDLRSDPGEERDLAAERPEHAARLERALLDHFAGLPAPGPPEPARGISPETGEALRGLGYLE